MKQHNNVRFIRVRRNITIDRLVEMTDIPKTTLQRIETEGSEWMLNRYRDLLAKALKCKPEELDAPDIGKGVPIIGYIKFKCYLKRLPESKWKEAEFIPGLPETAQAIRVASNSLVPYHNRNDLLYFNSKPEKNPAQFLGKQCLVEVPKGNELLVWLSAVSTPKHFILHHYGAPHAALDQKVAKVYPILHVKRG